MEPRLMAFQPSSEPLNCTARREVHLSNAQLPMLVTVPGILTICSAEQ